MRFRSWAACGCCINRLADLLAASFSLLPPVLFPLTAYLSICRFPLKLHLSLAFSVSSVFYGLPFYLSLLNFSALHRRWHIPGLLSLRLIILQLTFTDVGYFSVHASIVLCRCIVDVYTYNIESFF